MDLLLDIQSELSLPEGGCATDRLVRRAVELGVSGLALADRGNLAAASGFVRLARSAGIEPRVGVRLALGRGGTIELLLFPRNPEVLSVLELLVAAGTEVGTSELLAAGGEEALLALAVVNPRAHRLDSLKALRDPLLAARSVLGRGLALAIPDSGSTPSSSLLVELGRDLDLPLVLAPPIHFVEVEDASLHRLLTLIRGDRESGEGTPRPGRPTPLGGRLALRRPGVSEQGSRLGPRSLVEAAAVRGEAGMHEEMQEATREFFGRIAPPDSLIEPPAPDLVRDAEDMELLRQRVLAVCAGRRQLPPARRLTAELEALARCRALGAVLRLFDVVRSLADRPALGVAPQWSESWVGWALGLASSPPEGSRPSPAWTDGHGSLPPVEIETGQAVRRAALGRLELAGAREPLAAVRLSAREAARWLAAARGFDAAHGRRLMAVVEGRTPAPERAPPGSRRLAGLAVRLSGRVVALAGDANIRVWTPFSAPGRRLPRLAEDALAAGGLAVRVVASPTLTLLERADGVGRIRLTTVDRSATLGWGELAELLSGPLAGRAGPAFARALRARQPKDIRELARTLVLVRRAPDAPAPRLGGPSAGVIGSAEIVFTTDMMEALRARGVKEETARELLARAAFGRGAPLAVLGLDLERELVAAGEPPERAEAVFAALVRLVPHLEEEGPWLARAGALAALGELARDRPLVLAAAMADLLPSRLQAVAAWARAHGVAILPASLDASTVNSGLAGGERGRTALRLGLVHLPGVDRATAEVIASIRAHHPFENRGDLLRRLRGRIPERTLRALVGGEGRANFEDRANFAHTPSMGSESVSEPVRASGGGRPYPAMVLARGSGRDTMQYDLFAPTRRNPRIFTAALSRYGILSLDRAARSPEGSRIRTVGVIRGLRGTVARGGRRHAASRLEDGDQGLDLLLLPALLDAAGDIPLGRPVVVEGRLTVRAGVNELVVESAVPLEFLSSVVQPALEVVLPIKFRRLRALKLRLLKSPGRSPLRVHGRDAEGVAAAAGLSRFGITVDDALIADLRSLVGDDNVYLAGRVAGHVGVQGQAGAA